MATWSHVAVTYDGAQLRLYVNGGLDATLAASGALSASTRPVQVGTDWYGDWYSGRLDEVRLYSAALTTEEIAALANQTNASSTLVAGGTGHTLLVTPDHTVWAFGLNNNGQLGDNTITTRKSPFPIAGLSGVTAVATGAYHSLALTSGGVVYAWGDNQFGQIGDGSTTDRRTPVALPLSGVTAIAAGEYYSLALLSNGDVYAWGRNTNGQLGTGNTTQANAPVLVASGAKAIGAGLNHSLIVKTDGTAWAAGLNTNGQLGVGSTTSSTSFVQVTGITTAVAAAGGTRHSVFLLSDGTLKAAGYNLTGQLGDTTTTQRTSPVAVSALTNVSAIDAGADHTLAAKADGTLWAWGENGDGQIGDGTITDRKVPTPVSGLSSIAAFAAGFYHSLAVTSPGVVYTWGRNNDGELGEGTTTDRAVAGAISGNDYAWKVATPVFSVAAGTYNTDRTVVVTVDTAGAMIHYTQNGVDPTEADATIASGASLVVNRTQILKARAFKPGMPPGEVQLATYTMKVALPAVSPAAGTYTSARIVTMSTATPGATLRYTTDGSDPTDTSTAYVSPITVATTTTLKIVGFKTDWSASDVRTATYTMNFGTLAAPAITPATGTYEGQVSVTLSSAQSGATIRYTTNGGTPTATSTPYTAPLVLDTSTTLKAKVFHPDYTTSPEASAVYTLTATTPVLSVPSGTYAPGAVVTISSPDVASTLRMTLDGTDPTASSPTIASGTSMFLGAFTLKVRAFKTGNAESAVASGTYALSAALGAGAVSGGGPHTMLATPDGRVFAWGENANGQIGDGATVDRPTPVLVPTLTGVTAVAGGQAHTLARTWDGQVYAWGANGSGRPGDGTTTQRTRPVQVTALTNIASVAAGDGHSLALTADGRVFAWGLGSSGQLGLGSTASQTVPTEVPGLSTVVAIAAGDTHSLAVTAGGQLYAWGSNASSKLGDGTTTTRTSPTVIGLSNVVAVAAGASHSLALLRDGTVYAWGLGSSGQLGLGTTTTMSTPTLVPGLTASAIAAGNTHSAAVRSDGVLVAWGANASGQLGDATTTTRTVPTTVAGPASVSTIALGDTHSVAVTPDGAVWMWGAGASGQLGDGGLLARATPQAVMTAGSGWAPAAPALSVASGTFNVEQSVSIAASTAEATLRYTLTGADPAETDAEVPATGVVDIGESAHLRARAWVGGRLPGAIARAEYTLQVAAPVITPGAGTYTSAQTVSLTSGDPVATVRYTLDGTDPAEVSTLYTEPFSVGTFTIVKARAFRAGAWAPSEVAQAVLQFDFGTLETPTALPAGGVYADAQTIALSSSPNTTIRYTLDGTDPSAVSNLYVTPIPVTAGMVVLKARAFHPDWTMSPVLTETYTIDAVAPTITASLFPSPLNGWHSSPVTVSFSCADNVGIASCSTPTTVDTAGAGQTVSGTAVDQAGRQAMLDVTVNLDLTAPEVSMTAPADGLVTADTTVQLTGQATDALSGIVAATCNGVAATVVNGEVSCLVPLRPGRNAVVLHARDAAGNTKSAGVTVTRVGTATRLTLAPAMRTLLVDEVTSLSLTDDFGAIVAEATWTSSDPAIVSLSTDDPPVLTAVASGTVTVSAAKNGLTADATITVIAGTSLPEGTTRWTVAPTPGLDMAAPIYTNRVDASVPDLFTVETDAAGTTTVRAVTASGEVQWSAEAPGVPLMGDSFGGLVAAVIDAATNEWTTYVRFAGPDSSAPWRYESPGSLDRDGRAQAPDGTIYAIEYSPYQGANTNGTGIWDKSVIVLDGATGRVTARVPLPREVVAFESANDGLVLSPTVTCRSMRVEQYPLTVGPIVGADGQGYLVVRQRVQLAHGSCIEQGPEARETDVGLTLLRLSPSGVSATEVIHAQHCSAAQFVRTLCDAPPQPQQLLPDGLSGMLATAIYTTSISGSQYFGEKRVTRYDDTGRADHVVPWDMSILMTGDANTAYVGTGGTVHAFDSVTWTSKWTTSGGTPVVAIEGGGAVLDDGFALRVLDGGGELLDAVPHDLNNIETVLGVNLWMGLAVNGSSATIGPDIRLAEIGFNWARGDFQRRSAPARGCVASDFSSYRKGWEPGAEVTYMFMDPQNWNPLNISKVTEAFELWKSANIETGLNVSFREITDPSLEPHDPMIPISRVALGPNVGAQVRTDLQVRGGLGYIYSIPMEFNNNDTYLPSERTYLKAALHEIGHTLGLNHKFGVNRSSVMNHFVDRVVNGVRKSWDDSGNGLPTWVTKCDAKKAYESKDRIWP